MQSLHPIHFLSLTSTVQSSSIAIALTGQSETQAPQSMQSSSSFFTTLLTGLTLIPSFSMYAIPSSASEPLISISILPPLGFMSARRYVKAHIEILYQIGYHCLIHHFGGKFQPGFHLRHLPSDFLTHISLEMSSAVIIPFTRLFLSIIGSPDISCLSIRLAIISTGSSSLAITTFLVITSFSLVFPFATAFAISHDVTIPSNF